MASILDPIRAFSIVAACHLADPIGRVASNHRNGRSGKATTQKPEKVPAAPPNRISSSVVVEFELADGEVRLKVDVSCQHG